MKESVSYDTVIVRCIIRGAIVSKEYEIFKKICVIPIFSIQVYSFDRSLSFKT